MKILHSFWSKQAVEIDRGLKNCAATWIEPKYHWLSWILSAHQAHKVYGDIELITDREGAKLLAGILGLPYSNVHVCLDKLDHPSTVWTAGKLTAYSMMKEPFFHIDGDVYLWKKLSPQYLNTNILAQSTENPTNMDWEYIYGGPKREMYQYLPNIPEFLNTNERIAYNCGIFGGNDIDTITNYSKSMLAMLNDSANKSALKKLYETRSGIKKIWGFNCTIEQHALAVFLRSSGIKPKLLFGEDDEIFQDKKQIEIGYTHVLAGKQNPFKTNSASYRLEKRIMKEYPKEYEALCEWLGIPAEFGPTLALTNIEPEIKTQVTLQWT